jgi:hypothetical protein
MAMTLQTADKLTSLNILWKDEASLLNIHLRHGMIIRDIVVVLPEDVPLAVRGHGFSTGEFQGTGHGGLLGCGILWWQDLKQL